MNKRQREKSTKIMAILILIIFIAVTFLSILIR